MLFRSENAHPVFFDDHSKFIFFSDIHRGDNSLSDEFAHNQNVYYHALKHYLDEGFTYIEVGDGDELWEHSKFEVIRYAHSDVFMLLRELYDKNRFIMLFAIYLNGKFYIRKPKIQFQSS